MVSLTDVRTHNASLKNLAPGLVAIFVGGTSGMGLQTARELARNANAPNIYIVGRNKTEATRVLEELHTINPSSQLNFIQKDVSLLRNVDEACKEIKEKEKKVNFLFMTMGYITMQGRTETTEGLDRKFALHYYARMRFINQLSPLLDAASRDPDPNASLSRAVAVLDPFIGHKSKPNFNDLDLKNNFSLRNCATHASSMCNFSMEHFAKQLPGTSFIHASPSIVNTGVAKAASRPLLAGALKMLYFALKPWTVDLGESGERHLFAATAPRYSPKGKKEGIDGLAVGADGVKGSGCYHASWDGETSAGSQVMKELREEGAEEKIWTHTEQIFKKICEEGERC